MHAVAAIRNQVAIGKLAGVVLLIVLVLGLGALASSPSLHLRLCPSANRPGHHCAVTDFTAGFAEAPAETAIALGLLMTVFAAKPPPEILHLTAPVFRLSPSRAPPV